MSRARIFTRTRIAWLGWALLLGACEADSTVATLPESESFLGADGIIMGGTTTITNDQGIRTARLQFDTAFQWRDSTHQSLRGVDLVVYNEEDGTQRATVTAIRGRFEPRDERLQANGNVVLVIPFQNRRLETEELHYDPEAEELRSDSAVVLIEGGRRYQGTAFSSDLEFENFVVYGSAGVGP